MAIIDEATREPMPSRRRGVGLVLPLALFLALAGLFLVRLGSGDPSKLPSALIGKPVPEFALPALADIRGAGGPIPGLSSEELRQGTVTVVNVFASWCIPCHQEHPFLMRLAEGLGEGVRLVGINYKDEADNARRFLGRNGNPFSAIGVDANGRAAIDWGVYGVPETFVVRGDGTIAYKIVGPLDEHRLETVLKPEIARASARQGDGLGGRR